MHILRKMLLKLCVGTCLLEPNVATPRILKESGVKPVGSGMKPEIM